MEIVLALVLLKLAHTFGLLGVCYRTLLSKLTSTLNNTMEENLKYPFFKLKILVENLDTNRLEPINLNLIKEPKVF